MREHTLPVSEKFSGDLDKCRGFLTHLSFRQQAQAYATDSAKIALIIQLMTGRALKWAQAVLCSNPNVSYPDFQTKFRCVFDKGSNPDAAAHRLFSLKQCKKSVANFSVDFWILAVETGWEEKALRGAFLNNLNEGLRRELATKELPKSLDALINMCVSLDNHMREYGGRSEEARRATGSPGGWLSASSDGGGEG